MTKRIVGRRVVEDHSHEELTVTVYRRWPWQVDQYVNQGNIGVEINRGVLMITMPDEITSYNSSQWRRVVSKTTPARARV